MTIMPIPSPRAYPLALESKEKDRPSGLKKPSALSPHWSSGSKMRFAPPTRALRVGLDSDRIDSHARCKAVMELEHAVSQVTDGPRRLLPGVSKVQYIQGRSSECRMPTYKNQLTRFESMESAVPVFAYCGAACKSLVRIVL